MHLPQEIQRFLDNPGQSHKPAFNPRQLALCLIACALALALCLLSEDNA
ncbi:MAG TPA: hypothetical protein PLL10_02250 [Elusimicrobiales bacterium]|nr:hypothetical protein [Elusimicrobiales bacterium]